MNWKVRHEGSPQSVDGLSLEQVLQGLHDGQWGPTDEVMGPEEADWLPLESHPATAEAAAEVEPPPPRTYDDETRLDMTPLIDVCLVLLVFFIMTATVAALQTQLEAPTISNEKAKVAVVTKKEVAEQMIVVKATMENGEPVIRVEDDVVELAKLVRELRGYVRSTRKTMLLLEHDDEVPQDTVVQILDKATEAGIGRVRLLVP